MGVSPKTPEERLSDLERDMTSTLVAVRALLNQQPPAANSGRLRSLVEKTLFPMIPTLIIFVMGYFLIDSVKQDLEERRLETLISGQIRPLVETLIKTETPYHDAEAAALSLAGFGRYAVIPLLGVLDKSGENGFLAAKKGLIHVGRVESEKKNVCDVLTSALNDRGKLYNFRSHEGLISIITQLKCCRAKETLLAYQQLVRDPTRFGKSVDTGDMEPDALAEKLTAIYKQLDNELSSLEVNQ
jgi:hypothetical protein